MEISAERMVELEQKVIQNNYEHWKETDELKSLELSVFISKNYGSGDFGIWQGDECIYIGHSVCIWNYIKKIRLSFKNPKSPIEKYIASNGGVSAFRFKKVEISDVPSDYNIKYLIAKYRPKLNKPNTILLAQKDMMRLCESDCWYDDIAKEINDSLEASKYSGSL